MVRHRCMLLLMRRDCFRELSGDQSMKMGCNYGVGIPILGIPASFCCPCHTPIAMRGPSVSLKFLVAQAWLREPSQISSSTGGKRKDTRSSEMQNAWVTQRPTHVPRRAGEAPGKRWPSQISRLLGASQCLALCPPGTLQPCCSH